MVEPTAVAVVGLAGRFPGAHDATELWRNVLARVSSIRPLPKDRFHHERYFDPEIGAYGKSYSAIGGVVEDFALDSKGIALPSDVLATVDTAHRWALDVARNALLDAGLEPGALRGRRSGVIIGHARGSMLSSDLAFATASEGLTQHLEDVPELGHLGAAGRQAAVARAIQEIRRRYPTRGAADLNATLASALAGRISEGLGLEGRHMVVDAACASSFAAMDAAIRALSLGRLDVVLTGGASYSQELSVVLFAQSRALSPDGSFPFDERANGFISSDGIGLFVLMRLDDALAAKARIRAVIRSIGASCDGKGKALWAPRKEGQVLAMRRAYEIARVDPGSIGLLEAHATSTPIGDATEVSALEEVFGSAFKQAKRKLPIGSIKGNLGHAREAAGAAGLIKVIAALEEQQLPPTGNFEIPSRSIPWSDVHVEVSTEARPFTSDGPRRAAVNAFGIGGLNFHLLVEEAPPARRFHAVESRLSIEAVSRPAPVGLDIAIVGLGTRVPEGSSPEALFSRLLEGKESFSEATSDRWAKELFKSRGAPEAHRTTTTKGAFLRGFAADWRRYRIPPKLVEQNDPLQFMLLESAVDGLFEAGIDPSTIDRTRTAVVMGTVFGSDYALDLSLAIRAVELAEELALAANKPGDRSLIQALTAALRRELPTINEDSSGSFSSSTLASRIAKTLDLMGPTYTVDAACASAFAAIEAAAELLRSGGADLAIAGGGDRAMRVQRFSTYDQAGILSHQEACRAFEPNADGLLPGEGAAVLILQRLEDARAQGRPIHAVIRGIGSATGPASLTQPSSEHLARAMRAALAEAKVSPKEISYLESHGLGVPAFDAAELAATRAVYGAEERPSPLLLGAVKRQLGHAPGAAGAEAVLKAAMAIDRRQVPPIGATFEGGGELSPILRGSTQAEALNEQRALAAVSGMSFGGASYHLVLENGGPRRSKPPSPPSGGGAEKDWVVTAAGPSVEEICSNAELQSSGGPARVAFVARSNEEHRAKLELLKKTGGKPAAKALLRKQGVFARATPPAAEPRTALLFSGQGSQYGGMMAELARASAPARLVLSQADAWLVAQRRQPISGYLTGKQPIPNDVFVVQASLLVADLMAFEALREAKVEAAWITGHSYGDYPALVAAGAWSLETALLATALRAEAIEATVAPGGMISVTAPRAKVEAVLGALHGVGTVVPSNLNAPNQTVVSGTPEGLEAAIAAFTEAGVEAKRLAVPRAFHSPLMAEASGALAKSLRSLELVAPKTPFLSSVTGTFLSEPQAIRDALVEQLTRPVDFVGQIETLVQNGATVFLECGPKAVLTGLVDQIVPLERDVDALSVDDASEPGAWALARVSALFACRGTPAAPSAGLSLLEAEPGLIAAPGFRAFWAKNKLAVEALVRGLWQAEAAAQEVAAKAKAESEEPALEAEPAAAAPEPKPASSAPAIAGVDREEIKAFLIEAMAAQTGYPKELLDPDADLEADLGIDTVKQAQVLGKVRDRYQLRADSSLSLADFPTIHKVLAYVEGQLAQRASAPPKPDRPRAPLVDVTARRSSLPAPAIQAVRPSSPPPAPAPKKEPPALAAKVSQVPRSTKKSEVAVLELVGTAREIGRQHGEAMRAAIRDTMDRYESFLGDRALSAMSVPEATRFFPALFEPDTLEELRGIAEGVGVPFEHLLAYNLDAALFPSFTPGCTQALRTAQANRGGLVHAANEDSPLLLHLEGHQTRVVQIRRRTDGPIPGRKTVLFSLAGQVAGPSAVSDSGLTITSCTLLDAEPPSSLPNAPPHPQLVKRLIETATSLEHAEELVKKSERAGRWSLLISDADRDRGLYLEYDGGTVLGRSQIEGVWVATNHALLAPSPGAPDHSRNRLQRASELLGNGTAVDATGAQRALRDRFDVARGREVSHPTMNTIRRVDNVMSLVVEPKERRLFVTDRIEAPAAEERAGFLTIHYGSCGPDVPTGLPRKTHAPLFCAPLKNIQGPSASLEAVDEVMHRSVVRLVTEAAPAPSQRFLPKRLLLLGEGPRTAAIAEALAARGTELLKRPSAKAALLELGSLGAVDGVGFVLPTGAATQRAELVEAPFELLRALFTERKLACIFAVTNLGGGLGFDNIAQATPEHGAIIGLLKALRRELDGLQVQVLDTATTAAPEQVAAALLAELDAGSPRLEVGLLQQRRVQIQLVPRAAEDFSGGAEALPKTWLLTGGARGITAEIGKRLASLYGPTLHLLGRQPLPKEEELAKLRGLDAQGIEAHKRAILTELRSQHGEVALKEWRARADALDRILEIDRNLTAMRSAGSEVRYHAVDLADRGALADVLAVIRRETAIEGIVHGAGVEVAKPFPKKDSVLLAATLSGKVDGLLNLLALTEAEPLSHLVAFSSVSGRFGGHGQTDYSLANELLARIVGKLRLDRPGLRATAIAWPGWAEVGLAARSSARAFLEATGQKLMSSAEGANHFLRELWSGLLEPEVVIAERLEALDLDRTLVPMERLPAFRAAAEGVERAPLLGRLVQSSDERIVVERRFDAREPFLDQHRMGKTPILPAVIGLEVLSELASLESERWTVGDVDIHVPLKVPEGQATELRAERRGEQLRLTAAARRPDGVVLEAERAHFTARRLPRRPVSVRPVPAFDGNVIRYPYPDAPDQTAGSRMIFHGPVFRCLEGVVVLGEGRGLAKLVMPAPELLVPGSDPRGWRLPAALLDGCLQAAGLLGRITFGVISLPAGFGRVDVSARVLGAKGQEVLVEIVQHQEAEELVSELYGTLNGEPLLLIERYRAQVLRKL